MPLEHHHYSNVVKCSSVTTFGIRSCKVPTLEDGVIPTKAGEA